jgi:hypothetical protein
MEGGVTVNQRRNKRLISPETQASDVTSSLMSVSELNGERKSGKKSIQKAAVINLFYGSEELVD